MPPALLNAYSENLARLQAEESLVAAERVAVGGGRLKRGVGSRIISSWSRLAAQKRPIMRAKSAEQHRAYMASMGIAVKIDRPPDG